MSESVRDEGTIDREELLRVLSAVKKGDFSSRMKVRGSKANKQVAEALNDIILLNDPYRGGTHLNDVTMLYPVFEEGELLIFPAVRAHWADVGGMTPGS